MGSIGKVMDNIINLIPKRSLIQFILNHSLVAWVMLLFVLGYKVKVDILKKKKKKEKEVLMRNSNSSNGILIFLQI